MGVPATLLFKDGKDIDEIRGKAPREEFDNWLNSHTI